jgi:dTDP-4-dehydrorhamnose reductase
MHVLIVGAAGQLGRALMAEFGARAGVQVTAWDAHGCEDTCDITDPTVADAVAALKPDVVVNCAAWTQVDAAESQVDETFAANSLGPLYLAQGCAACSATLVQFSTNEVFAGTPGVVYYEYDQPAPRSVYARSKLGGELAAARSVDRLYIVRIAWLYGPGGNHFPAKIVAAADRHATLRVVNDEFGNPTYAPDVAEALAALLETQRYGVYHLVNGGHTSRYEWAGAVLAATGRGHVPIQPVSLDEWPRPAPPPHHAVLANQAAAALGIVLRPWEEALAEALRVEHARYPVPAHGARSK